MLKQFIELLSRDLGFSEPLVPEEDGSYLLLIEPQLEISLRENPDSGITLFVPLGFLPSERRDEFLRYAMTSNLLGKETGGGILGLDNEGKQMTFTQFLPQQLTYKEFHHFLEDFVNYAESWRMEIAQFGKKSKSLIE